MGEVQYEHDGICTGSYLTELTVFGFHECLFSVPALPAVLDKRKEFMICSTYGYVSQTVIRFGLMARQP